ncbi:hypothetical protein BV22DRAFT_1043516 [Leucogyrophana mollusca]|uniref:Uncharacterized protein n=1 Tax=Leucogyrophana mollusca TaxID=85980 RepID=A0ACB8BWB4_9AGAM|nr:hypothetical protein BV22DRAFT_1043516 [Leucogyrophana mollusca]
MAPGTYSILPLLGGLWSALGGSKSLLTMGVHNTDLQPPVARRKLPRRVFHNATAGLQWGSAAPSAEIPPEVCHKPTSLQRQRLCPTLIINNIVRQQTNDRDRSLQAEYTPEKLANLLLRPLLPISTSERRVPTSPKPRRHEKDSFEGCAGSWTLEEPLSGLVSTFHG